ncbi:MAG TPA: ABC transporter permease [Planctomycetota bacterium]|nr:ABC transporter permease [Planctomycetota bacterium]
MAIPLAYSFRSIMVRRGSSAMAVAGIALVVVVFVALLALAAGFKKAVASSGSAQNILLIRKGADAELQSQVPRDAFRVISALPIVASDADGKPLCVAESVIILSRKKRDGGDTNITFRGTPEDSRKVHTEVKLTQGRWFRAGTTEAVIGIGLARRLEGFSVGQVIMAGRTPWQIVGVFEAEGSGLESEAWIDNELMQSVFNRGNIFQSVLLQAAGDPEMALKEMQTQIQVDPRLRSLEASSESAYYAKQSQLMAGVITVLGGLLTSIMAVGAIVGAMNTMYAAVSQRKREIGCMLAMGFTPEAVWLAFIIESLILSTIGAAIGCSIAMLFNGMKTGTANWVTFSETAFEFHITPEIAIGATALALVMGFIGGFLPALHAARMKVVEALRRA